MDNMNIMANNNPMMMNMNMMNNMNLVNNPMMNMNIMNFFQNMNNVPKNKNTNLGRLPRDKATTNYTPFILDNNSINFNVVFSTPSGNRTNINTPIDIKVIDLLGKYMEKIGLGPNLIGNGIYFLYDGRKLKKEDYNNLVGGCFQDGANIIVLDAGNLIGA